MNIYRTKKLDKKVKKINEMAVSEFLIEGKRKALLIDTGLGIFNIKKYVEKLTKKDLMVVNSHFHPDHSNGNHLFKDVYIGEKDMPFTKDENVYFKLVDDITTGVYERFPAAKFFLKPIVKKIFMTKKGKTKYRPLKDGEVIDLGKKELIVKELPGHTPGSITFLDPDEKLIYACDACNMATWLFTNPDCKLSDYANNLEQYYKYVKKNGYKKMYGSHVPFANRISFIKDYAKFIHNINEKSALVKFNIPGVNSPLCVAVKPSIKHFVFACLYFEKQI